jgi:hypothetical protein
MPVTLRIPPSLRPGRIVTVNADDFTAFLAGRLAAIVPARP